MDAWRIWPYRFLLLALLFTAALEANLVLRSGTVGADGMLFIRIAQQLPTGVAETLRAHDQHPGFPALVLAMAGVIHRLGYPPGPESWMLAAQLVSSLCGLLSIVVVWLFAREMFGPTTANVAALIWAVLPIPRIDAAGGQSDTPHLLLYITAAWLASSALLRGDLRRLAAAGVCSSLAFWIRPEGWEVFWVALAALAVQAVRLHWPARRWAIATAALVVPALLVAAPYLILAGKVTSKQVGFSEEHRAPTYIEQVAELPIASTETVPAVAVPAAPLEREHRYTLALAFKVLGQAVAQLAVCLCQGFKFAFIPFYLYSWVALAKRQTDWAQIVLLSIVALTHMLVLLSVYILSGYIWHRHVLPIIALAMPFTGLGLVVLCEDVAGRLHWPRVPAIAITLAVSAALLLPYALRPFNLEFLPVIEATRWVAAHAAPGTGIVSNSPYASYYGELPTTEIGPRQLTIDGALMTPPVPARYDYVVLHVGAHDYRPEWLEQLATRYRQVRRYEEPNCPPHRHREVLVFEAQGQNALHDAHDDRRRS